MIRAIVVDPHAPSYLAFKEVDASQVSRFHHLYLHKKKRTFPFP